MDRAIAAKEKWARRGWRVRGGRVVADDDECLFCHGTGVDTHEDEALIRCANCGLRWPESRLDDADWTCRCGWFLVAFRSTVENNIAWELTSRARDAGEIPNPSEEDDRAAFDFAEHLVDVFHTTALARLRAQSLPVFIALASAFRVKFADGYFWVRSDADWSGGEFTP